MAGGITPLANDEVRNPLGILAGAIRRLNSESSPNDRMPPLHGLTPG
jgi:hypothetical protein